MTESQLVDKIKKYLSKRGGYFFKVHGGMYQKRGVPDILYWERGEPYAFEVKLPDGKHPVSALQHREMVLMREAGIYAVVVRSVEDVEDALTSIF